MKLTFLGAARTVTGSCYLLEVNGKKMLVDCGMFQGSKSVKDFNEKPFAFNPAEVDAMVLTHAHVDHSGLIPRLVKEGFKGRVHCTKSTQQLCTILLPDSAHIQESDAAYANRKGLRAGKSQVLQHLGFSRPQTFAVGICRIGFLDVGAVRQQNRTQLLGRFCAVNAAFKAFLHQTGDQAAVVHMGMGQDHGVHLRRIEGKGFFIKIFDGFGTLEHAAVHQHLFPVHFQ